MLAARHAERVVGADFNPHALSCARLSARISGVGNVTWVQGDWFEPVRGRRFDLVVVNPSMIITPDNAAFWRDSPDGRRALSRRLVRESADHLNESGFATVLCHWPHHKDVWEDDPREWVAELGCDALLLQFASHDPLAYAMNNAVDRPDTDPAKLAETVADGRTLQETRWSGSLPARSSCAPVPMDETGHARSSSREGPTAARRRSTGADVRRIGLPGCDSGARQLRCCWQRNGVWSTGSAWSRPLFPRTAPTGRPCSDDAAARADFDAPVDARVVPVLVGCDGRALLSARC